MAWTTPATAVTGVVITSSFFNTNLRDNLNVVEPNLFYVFGQGIFSTNTLKFTNFSNFSNTWPGNWRYLRIVGMIRSTVAATTDTFKLQINTDTGANYDWGWDDVTGTQGLSDNIGISDTAIQLQNICGANAPSNVFTEFELILFRFTAALYRDVLYRSNYRTDTTTTGAIHTVRASGWWKNNSNSITELDFSLGSGNFDANSKATLYMGSG